MAKRKKTSTGEDFIELVALLPWWAALCLGTVSYFVLHAFAMHRPPSITRLDQVGDAVTGTVISSLAMVFQYVIPVLCAAAAMTSVLRRRRRIGLVSHIVSSNTTDALHDISWQDFELLVGEGFRLQGYQVVEHGGAGPDGGVDLVLRKGSEKFVVQCKQWKNTKVSVQVVRELFGVMSATGATGGFVVTSGTFSEDADAFASGRNIQLISGSKLTGLLRQARNAKPLTVARRPAAPRVAVPSVTDTQPSCPLCSGAMVSKRANRGANAGGLFWSCARFPACRGARQV